jgi:hypothetical protein
MLLRSQQLNNLIGSPKIADGLPMNILGTGKFKTCGKRSTWKSDVMQNHVDVWNLLKYSMVKNMDVK